MNLEKIKILEDLKKKSQDLSKQANTQFQDRRRIAIDSARSTFKNYFQDKGFTVQDSGSVAVAKYGGTSISLEYPTPDQSFFGIASRLDLKIAGSKTETYIIPINPKGKFPRMTIEHMDIRKSPQTEEELLDKNIAGEEEKVKKAEEMLNTPKDPFVYGLKSEGTAPTAPYPQFDTFDDLLNNIFK